MGSGRHNSWLACPKCGHKVARVRTCDAEFKCKHCGHEFVAIIGPAPGCESTPPEKDKTEE